MDAELPRTVGKHSFANTVLSSALDTATHWSNLLESASLSRKNGGNSHLDHRVTVNISHMLWGAPGTKQVSRTVKGLRVQPACKLPS